MTSYSAVIGVQKSAVSFHQERPGLYRSSLVLIMLASAMMLGYVFLANFLVSQRYVVSARKSQFHQLSLTQPASSLGADDAGIKELLQFAQKSGMVEAKGSDTIIEDLGVALSKPGL